jgi:hypothetical protein
MLHNIEEEARHLSDKCTGMEGRFKEVSVMVKELETVRYKHMYSKVGRTWFLLISVFLLAAVSEKS